MASPLPNSPMFDWRRFIAIAETEKGHDYGFSTEQTQLLERALMGMSQTPEGRQALVQAWNNGQNFLDPYPLMPLFDGDKIVILHTNEGDGDDNSASLTSRTIRLSLERINNAYMQTPEGLKRVSPQEVLVHEIYHMADPKLVDSTTPEYPDPTFQGSFWRYAAQKMVHGNLSDEAKSAVMARAMESESLASFAQLGDMQMMTAPNAMASLVSPYRRSATMADVDAFLALPSTQKLFDVLAKPELRDLVREHFKPHEKGLNWGAPGERDRAAETPEDRDAPYHDEILANDFTIVPPKNADEAKALLAWVMDTHFRPHEDRATQFTDAFMATYSTDAIARRDYGNFCIDNPHRFHDEAVHSRTINPDQPQTTAYHDAMAALLRGEDIPKLNLPNANADVIVVSPCAGAVTSEQLASGEQPLNGPSKQHRMLP